MDKNRELLRQAGALQPLTAMLELPLPQSENTIMIALRSLSNLAVDDATATLMTNNNLFGPLVKLLESNNQNLTLQTVTCLQNMISGIFSNCCGFLLIRYLESSIGSMAKAGALDSVIKLGKSNPAFLPKIALIYAMLLMDGMHA